MTNLLGVLFSMPDNINHPPHYNRGSVETIDMIKNSMAAPEFEGYLQGNVIKYICRHKYKGGKEDLEKAKHFIDMIIERDYK